MFFSLSFSVLITLFAQTRPQTLLRFRSNLLLYEDYDVNSGKVIYTNSDKAGWKDLANLAKESGLSQKALLCGIGAGAWLAYPGSDFKLGNSSFNVWLLVGETCLAADWINSAQAVGPVNKEFGGLVTFTEANFGSDATLVSNTTSDSASGVKSIISGGYAEETWTIEGDGKKYCLVRPKVYTLGVCIIADIPTQLGMNGASVKVGCDDGVLETLTPDNPVLQFETCFGTVGAYRIQENYMPAPVVTSVCSGSGSEEQKLGFFKIVDAWKFRMNPERQRETNPADIDISRTDELNPTRMRLLNTFFAIFRDNCPLLTEEYFNLLRYIFMSHLRSAWEESPDVIIDKEDKKFNWRNAEAYLQECYSSRAGSVMGGVPEEMACVKRHPFTSSKPTEESIALDLFLEGDHLDIIIEQVWLMLNLVSPYCASALGLRDNIWVDFVSLFRRQILLPLVQQWVNPGAWQSYYSYMFHGYDLDRGKRKVISCVQSVISVTPSMDPIDRPSADTKQFLSRSKKRPAIVKPSYEPKKKKRQTRSVDKAGKKGKPKWKTQNAQHLLKTKDKETRVQSHSESRTNHRANRM